MMFILAVFIWIPAFAGMTKCMLVFLLVSNYGQYVYKKKQ